jgi:hypothetical protein
MSAEHLRTGSVRPDDTRDVRSRLVAENFFSMRPKPLERWVWQQGLPASAERVYWYHWDLGHRNGTWCSQVSIRIVGRDCCLDPATVTRAYQLLKSLDLIRREDPGRDPANPFQQATALTEVRVPRELLKTLGREPKRRQATAPKTMVLPEPVAQGRAETGPASPSVAVSREESKAIFGRFSAGERSRFAEASRHRRTGMEFDVDTRLGPTDRAHALDTLQSLAQARPVQTVPDRPAGQAAARPKSPRRLQALEVVRLQRSLRTLAAAAGTPADQKQLREVMYAVEEGALTKFPVPLAINIALKKLRDGAWSVPHRMPTEWGLQRAYPGQCSAAGQ